MIVDHEIESDERLDAWFRASGPWRPHPLSRPETPLPSSTRFGVLSAIFIAHAVVFWLLDVGSRFVPDETTGTVTTLVFVAPEPLPVTLVAPPPRRETPSPAAVSPAPGIAPVRGPTTDAGPVDPDAMVAVESPRAERPLQLYDADGSVALPDDVVARLAEVDADDRPFEFRLPGVVESGRFLDRPPALAYESTTFDQYWKPEQGALTDILEKMVEATTDYIEIPIPGTRGGKIVCSVSLLALAGSCGVRNNSNGFVVRGDDPATLSAEEDAQCRAWWDQIVGARGQDAWRHTRALYESRCRKPLATDDAVPIRG